jgi:hypothetical protein
MEIPRMGGLLLHRGLKNIIFFPLQMEPFPPQKRLSLLKDVSSIGKSEMAGPKQPKRNLEMAIFKWLLGGLALWVIFVPAPVGSFVVDDLVQIDEGSEPEAFQGASPPSWACAAHRGTWNTPHLSLVRLPSSPAAKDFLAGVLFRLKLVRLHPPIGPPRTFFA